MHQFLKKYSTESRPPFSPFWLAFWSCGLAIGWLLPNHYYPWIAFHFDAWIACGLALAAGVVLLRTHQVIIIHRFALISIIVALIPFVQKEFHLIQFSGQAWISSSFLIGFFISLVIGAHWELLSPGQAIDGIFTSIGIASIISVGLQIYQWLGISVQGMDLWIMNDENHRPFGNFIQPNQLATFLCWGIIACAWGTARKKINWKTAVFISAYFIFGVALTQSRTGFFTIIGLMGATFFWRDLWPEKKSTWIVFGIVIYYLVCILTIPIISNIFSVEETSNLLNRSERELRIPAYKLFIDAIVHKPFLGYGWGQTAKAQIAVAELHPKLGPIFMQAHNLFLDLFIWCGIFIGGLISLNIIIWFAGKVNKVKNSEEAILIFFIAIVGWHAMLEFPLHYAYMLLPTGLVIGVVNQKMSEPVSLKIKKWQFFFFLMSSIILLLVIITDYIKIESDFSNLRFERAGIGGKSTAPQSNIIILDHLEEFIKLGRTTAKENMTDIEITNMEESAYAFPSPTNMFNLAVAFSLNNKKEKAQLLVKKIGKITTKDQYREIRIAWENLEKEKKDLQNISWDLNP